MILLIDNYDSFVHNLERYFRQLGCDTLTIRNDAMTLSEIQQLAPSHIVLSPGPCAPDQAGICLDVVKQFSGIIPILGVCLGHQVIAQAFGGRVVRAKHPRHGMQSSMEHTGQGILSGLKSPFHIGHYHSLIVSDETLPAELTVTARSGDGEIMALQHHSHPTFGLQFHPESVLTEHGYDLLHQFKSIRFLSV